MYTFFDAHCDTITKLFFSNEELFANNCHISIKKLLSFGTPVQIFSVWLDKTHKGSWYADTVRVIEFFHEQLKKYAAYIAFASGARDIRKNKSAGLISAMLSIEGGEALEGDINNLEAFYNMGVRSLTLTWNYDNELGYGVLTESEDGLTDFGRRVITECERLGIVVDVSHLSERCFWDVAQICKKPFIASHSGCRAVAEHARNLTDEQITAIAKSGGVIGINLYPPFLTDKSFASVTDILRHAHHAVKLAGADHVGLGCDFDGIETLPLGFSGVESITRLGYLLNIWFGESTAKKILEKNMLRVFP